MSPRTPVDLAFLLAQANRQINGQLDAELRSVGVPLEQWRILAVLGAQDGWSMSELADQVLMNLPTLTKTIDRMISLGLVFRAHDPSDRRRVLIHLSDAGRALGQRLAGLADRHRRNIVERYGDETARELGQMLETLIERLG